MSPQPTARLVVVIPEWMKDAVVRYAKERGMTYSEAVFELLNKALPA